LLYNRYELDMDNSLNSEKIRELAKALDDAIEKHDVEELVSYFREDCELQLPGIRLNGHESLRKAIRWMYRYLREIKLLPVTIMIQNNIFFEEFVVQAKAGYRTIELRQKC
jgi:ketosteroid isomerase-like protein